MGAFLAALGGFLVGDWGHSDDVDANAVLVGASRALRGAFVDTVGGSIE